MRWEGGFELFGVFGWVGQTAASIIGALAAMTAATIVAALLFLVVRFLLVATRAAQLYVDRQSSVTALPQPSEDRPIVSTSQAEGVDAEGAR